jgi:hypothetical protein
MQSLAHQGLLAAWQEDADTTAASLEQAVDGLQHAICDGRVRHKLDQHGPEAVLESQV